MLHIETNNLLIHTTLTERVNADASDRKLLDRIVTDFDFTLYHLSTLGDSKNLLLISVYLKCWDDLAKYGVEKYLRSKYDQYNEVLTVLSGSDIEQSYNYSFVLDTDKLDTKDQEYKTSIVEALLLLKRNCMATAFEQAFARYDQLAAQHADLNTYSEEIQESLMNEDVLVLRYRENDESIYIKPLFDRVTVVFSTIFQDETDKIFGKVFLQEFVDARKRLVQTAPQVLYLHGEAPLDIQSVVRPGQSSDKIGYVTFVLFPRHLVKGDRRENCITHVQNFRNYFHYHIKCLKAYMHLRMRFRVKEFLKILNRAKPENLDEEGKVIENRKTASGRRFEVR